MVEVYYFDASSLFKRYFQEGGSAFVDKLLDENPDSFTASLTYAEIYSALCRLEREGRLSSRTTEQAFVEFEKDWENLKIIEFSGESRRDIPKLLRRFPLRGSDAIHLASAATLAERGIEFGFVVADRRLINAATDIGLKVINPASR